MDAISRRREMDPRLRGDTLEYYCKRPYFFK
jgi:hypothetical protein